MYSGQNKGEVTYSFGMFYKNKVFRYEFCCILKVSQCDIKTCNISPLCRLIPSSSTGEYSGVVKEVTLRHLAQNLYSVLHYFIASSRCVAVTRYFGPLYWLIPTNSAAEYSGLVKGKLFYVIFYGT